MILSDVSVGQDRKIIVVTRLLPTFGEPVVTHVEFVPEDKIAKNKTEAAIEEDYGNSVMNRIKDEFCSKFVEFQSAKWNWSFHHIRDPKQ